MESDDDEDLSADNQSSIDEEDENLPSGSEPDEDVSEPEPVKETSIIPLAGGSETPEDLSSTLRKTREEDRKKGKAVARQIASRQH
jgi:protein AATF/BFR2